MRLRSGLTLVEVVVGLTVAALAATLGAASLGWMVDGSERAPAATSAIAHAAAVRRSLTSWLECAYVADSGASPFRLTDHEYRGVADDELEFQTAARTPLGPDVTVRLLVDRDPRTPVRGLAVELTDWSRGRSRLMELDSAVTALEIAALTEMLGERQWVRSWMSAVLIPAAVELRVSSSASGRSASLLELPLRAALGGGR